jgi:hypothetical protein
MIISRARKALYSILAAHSIVLLMIGGFSIYLHQRVLDLKRTDAETTHHQTALLAQIQSSSDIEYVRRQAIKSIQLDSATWREFVSAMSHLDDGTMALVIVPAMTIILGVWGLWSRKGQRTDSANNSNER